MLKCEPTSPVVAQRISREAVGRVGKDSAMPSESYVSMAPRDTGSDRPSAPRAARQR